MTIQSVFVDNNTKNVWTFGLERFSMKTIFFFVSVIHVTIEIYTVGKTRCKEINQCQQHQMFAEKSLDKHMRPSVYLQ